MNWFQPTATFFRGFGGFIPQRNPTPIFRHQPLRSPQPRTVTPDTCPFPTPASSRYHISIVISIVFIPFGRGLPGSFPAQPHFRQKWHKMAQNDTEKTIAPKTAGPVSLPSRGDKTRQNQDIPRIKPDIDRTKSDKTTPAPRSNVRFCPVFPTFPPPQLKIGLRRGSAAARQ